MSARISPTQILLYYPLLFFPADRPAFLSLRAVIFNSPVSEKAASGAINP
jgi:hypothetical protein